jgi:hypothetical protein
VQSAGARHSTHKPEPSQSFPAPTLHGDPAGEGALIGEPLLHVSSVQGSASSRISASSFSLMTAP